MEFDLEQLFYLRDGNKKVGCIAIGLKGRDAYIAGSMCSLMDNFNHKQGRNIALKRLRSDNPKTRKLKYPLDELGGIKMNDTAHLLKIYRRQFNTAKADSVAAEL